MISPEDQLSAALGRIPSGLFIVTIRTEEWETGMLASWIQQCSFQPPLVSIAIARSRWTLESLHERAAIAINVLAEGEKAMLAHFGKGFDRQSPAFEGLEIERFPESAPCLLAAHAYLDGRFVKRVETGDHILVISEIVGGRVLHEARPATHVRRRGTHY